MTISEYRTKATDIIMENEAEYLALIERVTTDSEIQHVRYTNADACFVANILIPTVAEKWSAWRLSNSSASSRMDNQPLKRKWNGLNGNTPPAKSR